jgi:hypothetical protein
MVLLLEGLLGLDLVEADADHGHAVLREIRISVAERASLRRAAGCVGLGIEIYKRIWLAWNRHLRD